MADLAVAKIGSPNPVGIGAILTYTITVSNNGPSTASNVTLTDTLPAAVNFDSASPSQGTCARAGGVVTCSLGALPNGGSATVLIAVTTTAAGTIVNAATAAGDEPDPVPGNSTAVAAITVGMSVEVPTLSGQGFLILGLLLAAAGFSLLRRR